MGPFLPPRSATVLAAPRRIPLILSCCEGFFVGMCERTVRLSTTTFDRHSSASARLASFSSARSLTPPVKTVVKSSFGPKSFPLQGTLSKSRTP